MVSDVTMIALGGNALSGQEGQDKFQNFPELGEACRSMSRFQPGTLVVTHGNGPQIGELEQAAEGREQRSLDVLGAETEGLLGYQIEQELSNQQSNSDRVVTLLTRVEVDLNDPAFAEPTKPIGPWLAPDMAEQLAKRHNWQFIENAGRCRRIVPSPRPENIIQADAVNKLLDSGYSVICTGGGGIPVYRQQSGRLVGVEAVIDKDYASSLLARQLGVRTLYLVTDVAGVYSGWDTPDESLLDSTTPEALRAMELPPGSMGPKVEAACDFVEATGNRACIGALAQLEELLEQKAGTWIEMNPRGLRA